MDKNHLLPPTMSAASSSEVLLDLGSYGVSPYNGVGQVAIQYARALAAAGDGRFSFRLLLHPRNDASFFGGVLPVSRARRPVINRIARVFRPAIARRFVYDSVSHQLRHALHFRAALPSGDDAAPLILTLHDAIAAQENPPKKAAQYIAAAHRALDAAAIVVFVSEYARREVGEVFDLHGKQTRVIYNGVSAPQNPRRPRWLAEDGAPFLFAIGRVTGPKNFHLLAAMMGGLPDFRLIIAGRVLYPNYAAAIREAAKKAGTESRMTLAGAISEEEKAYLYRRCAAFLMPSRREGFGMPVIEAFHCGKPVFCARQTALPEVGGDCAFYWDDLNPEAMAAMVRDKMAAAEINAESEIARRKQWAARFSWDANVRAYLDLYDEALRGGLGEQGRMTPLR